MVLFEKTTLRFNKMIRNFLVHFIFWYISFLFFIFLSGQEQIFINFLNILELNDIYLIILILSGCISIFFTLIDGIFSDRILRFFPRRLMIFFKSISYLISIFLVIILAAHPPLEKFQNQNTTAFFKTISFYLPETDMKFIRFLVYFYLSGFLVNFLKSV